MNYPKPLPGTIHCVSCHSLNVRGCEECRRCAMRCGCICRECQNCTPTIIGSDGRRVHDRKKTVKHHPKYFCTICRKCKRVNSDDMSAFRCSCRARPSAPREKVAYKAGEFNWLQRPLGLEVEVSYVASTRLVVPPFVKYEWTHDGSLTPGGQELVLAPLVGDKFLQGITLLAEDFAKRGFAVDQSCGFHCHVGAEDFGAYELRRLINLYHKFESTFYSLVAKGRDGWREHRGERKYYAKRWDRKAPWYAGLNDCKDASAIRRYILEWLYEGRLRKYQDKEGYHRVMKPQACRLTDGKYPYMPWPPQIIAGKEYGFSNMYTIRSHKYENCRYMGLNIHTWFQRGTVEYRHHEGTIALDKMLYWPLWCGWFTELASVLTDAEVANLNTLDQLLEGEWKRPFKLTKLPVPVVEWVRKTLEERGNVSKTAA